MAISSLTRSIRNLISPRKSLKFRSDTALEAISIASEVQMALYNYPSFSGAFSVLFAHLFYSRLGLPCLVQLFSSVHPLTIDDLRFVTCSISLVHQVSLWSFLEELIGDVL